MKRNRLIFFLCVLVSCNTVRNVAEVAGISESPSAISTSFADADKAFVLNDTFANSKSFRPLSVLPSASGVYQLRPGFYEVVCKSYCLHAGTHAPSSGDGYLAAPLKGDRRDIIQSILKNSARYPAIKQQDVQMLIWLVLAHVNFKQLSTDLQIASVQLLSAKELFELDGGVMGVISDPTLMGMKVKLPPAAQDALDAENKVRELYEQGVTSYQQYESVAILPGAAPVDQPEYKRGRWCVQPGGFYIRFFPNGYTSTRIQIYVPDLVSGATNSGSYDVSPLKHFMIQWPAWDLTSTVAVPANTTAQRLGMGASGSSGGSSESWWDDPRSSDDWGHRDGAGSFRFPPTPNPVHAPQVPVSPKPAGGVKIPDQNPPVKTPGDNTPDNPDNPGNTPTPSPKPGDVDTGEVRKQLPDCFMKALVSFGLTQGQVLEWFKQYNNDRCSQQFFKLIQDYIKTNPHGLDDCNAYAIWGYTTNLFFRLLNQWLRDDINQDQTKDLTQEIDQALAKLPTYTGKYVYRGIIVPPASLKNFLALYTTGTFNVWNNFTSAGGTESASFAGRPDVNVVFIIEQKTGKDVSALADGIHCGMPPNTPPEILIKSNSTFQSTEDPVFDPSINKWVIHVKQID
jgi:hypothetical protein